ncbi:hypothetical protein KPH14_003766 [Odynerus spinipes]|uniref:Uncharacterized protein n=1 Tax=Odynerus spinipes TaxID=1348599 RepID=A0AAD9VUP5_9HYME|nr:hypothetical protein KPH14_003766 [Odynerus spinipes]
MMRKTLDPIPAPKIVDASTLSQYAKLNEGIGDRKLVRRISRAGNLGLLVSSRDAAVRAASLPLVKTFFTHQQIFQFTTVDRIPWLNGQVGEADVTSHPNTDTTPRTREQWSPDNSDGGTGKHKPTQKWRPLQAFSTRRPFRKRFRPFLANFT